MTGPHTTGPHTTGPQVIGPQVIGPQVIGPQVIGLQPDGPGRYRRPDGTALSAADLAECRPLHRGELRDLAWLLGLLEDWLLHTGEEVRADLAAFRGSGGHTAGDLAGDLIDTLGAQAARLHRLIR